MINKPAPQVLIVEDEPKVAALLQDYLQVAEMQTRMVDRGDAVIPALLEQPADVILLDMRIPGQDGFSVLRELSTGIIKPAPGIIVVSALVEEVDRLLGLELGADDYVCKPFSPREVVARVKALLRRKNPNQSNNQGKPRLLLNEDHMLCQLENTQINLTAVEFRLLQTLHSQPGRIFSRDQLMHRLYNDHRVIADRTVDSHVKKLRRKLDNALPNWELIGSVYGVGFRYEPQPKS